jgi:hypothetical protein
MPSTGPERVGVDGDSPPRHVQRWIAKCLLDGGSPHSVCEQLVASGALDESTAAQAVDAVQATAVFEAAASVAHRRDKLASLFDAFARQRRQSGLAEGGVPVEVRPSPERFFEAYYFSNRPVLLRGLADDWPALRRWSPKFFTETFGDVEVEVTADREEDPRYEDNFTHHRRQMTMRAFVEQVMGGAGNDVYLVAKNRILERPELASLLADISYPDGILDAAKETPLPRLWFGPEGTVTPLHHDSVNILFAQIRGHKLVRLISPFDTESVYNDRTCFSAVDLDRLDLDAFPRMRDVVVLETVVAPGDLLFLPLGWWHWVRSLDVSISLSFQNFAVPGPPVVWSWPRLR